MSDKQKIDFNLIPQWWAICLKGYCPQAQNCLRRIAFDNMPKGTTAWKCLMAEAMAPVEADGRCRYFAKNELAKFAYGFDTMMKKVNSRDGRYGIRFDLTNYFRSKGTYYRSKHGERQLSPADQKKVLSVFAQYGFNGDDYRFDRYEDGYDLEYEK